MSNFIVSARKYRPQLFAKVLGQEQVTKTLQNALQKNQIAHAFLFTGPRGVGKTTCARILAKVINCENRNNDSEPCNNCESCKMFASQASFNIIEMDAASNNSVEAIRSLVDQVRYQPQYGKYKVFIIDEVHMLSQAAFNAFLKTLEEPPAHAIFILATTERHKILPTILSRCQVYDFKRISNESIIAQLKAVAEAEGIKYEEDALHIIAQKAEGGMRDALSMFDRIASFSNNEVSYSEVISNLNILNYEYYFKMMDFFIKEDHIGSLHIFKQIHQLGFDGNLFIDGMSEHVRNLLVIKDQGVSNLIEGSKELQNKYFTQAISCKKEMLVDALTLLNECDISYEKARNKKLHVELALVKLCFLGRLIVSDKVDFEKKKPQSEIDTDKTLDTEKFVENLNPYPISNTPDSKKNIEIEILTEEANSPQVKELFTPKISSLKLIQKKAAQHLKTIGESAVELKLETFQKVWEMYLKQVELPSLKTILSQAELELDTTKLLIKVGSNHSKNIIQLEIQLLEKLRKAVVDNRLEISIVLDPIKAKSSDELNIKKTLSNKEKYELMKQANPVIDELINKLRLKIDHGN